MFRYSRKERFGYKFTLRHTELGLRSSRTKERVLSASHQKIGPQRHPGIAQKSSFLSQKFICHTKTMSMPPYGEVYVCVCVAHPKNYTLYLDPLTET